MIDNEHLISTLLKEVGEYIEDSELGTEQKKTAEVAMQVFEKKLKDSQESAFLELLKQKKRSKEFSKTVGEIAEKILKISSNEQKKTAPNISEKEKIGERLEEKKKHLKRLQFLQLFHSELSVTIHRGKAVKEEQNFQSEWSACTKCVKTKQERKYQLAKMDTAISEQRKKKVQVVLKKEFESIKKVFEGKNRAILDHMSERGKVVFSPTLHDFENKKKEIERQEEEYLKAIERKEKATAKSFQLVLHTAFEKTKKTLEEIKVQEAIRRKRESFILETGNILHDLIVELKIDPYEGLSSQMTAFYDPSPEDLENMDLQILDSQMHNFQQLYEKYLDGLLNLWRKRWVDKKNRELEVAPIDSQELKDAYERKMNAFESRIQERRENMRDRFQQRVNPLKNFIKEKAQELSAQQTIDIEENS